MAGGLPVRVRLNVAVRLAVCSSSACWIAAASLPPDRSPGQYHLAVIERVDGRRSIYPAGAFPMSSLTRAVRCLEVGRTNQRNSSTEGLSGLDQFKFRAGSMLASFAGNIDVTGQAVASRRVRSATGRIVLRCRCVSEPGTLRGTAMFRTPDACGLKRAR